MSIESNREFPICIIDRTDGLGLDAPTLRRLDERWNVQRVLPTELTLIRRDTRAIFVRAAYFSDLEEVVERLEELSWIHVAIAGTEHLPKDLLRQQGVILTNSAGVLDRAIGEFVVASALLWSKGLLQSVRDSADERVEHRQPLANEELRVLVVGAGGIGTAAAAGFREIGVQRVAGVRRTKSALSPLFDEHVDVRELQSRVSDFNVVVAALPAAPHTSNLIDRSVLAAVEHPAVFVNVGRGASVDHTALTDMLRRHPDSAAVLDVTTPEPLPNGHPLWHLPNAVVSPHMAGDTITRHERYARVFEENLERFVRGEEMVNRVVS